MIFNQWYVILESNELKHKRGLKVRRLGLDLALWRDSSGKACCIDDRCCHRGASLGCGRTVDGKLECPFHGFLYNGDGRVTLIPANGRSRPVPATMHVKAWQLHEAFGFIWMWWGDAAPQPAEPFFFSELADFSWSSLKDPWPVHYSRAIENQLDVVHLPFVHRTTIGRGNKTVVNGPVVVREGDLITFYVNNVADDGSTTALKPDQLPGYENFFRLQFHYPNIWQNYISDKIRAFAAFVPVDEENTLIYIRYYQRIVTVPLLREFVNWIGKVSSLIILWQDKRVVVTQIPPKSELRMDERLIAGDRPIVEYRRHRQELIDRGKGADGRTG